MRVANALDDLVHVGDLSLLVDAVLGDEQVLGLGQGAAHLGHDLLVLQGVEDGALAAVVAVVGGGGVAGVDGVELALDEGRQVVDPVDAFDGGDADVLKGRLVNHPLEELLKRHVQAGVGVLGGHDAVDGGVGIASTQVVRLQTLGVGVAGILDVAGQRVRGADGVLASNNMKGSLLRAVGAGVDALGNDGGDELEDVGADGAGDDVGGADLLDQIVLVGPGVDGAVVCDCVFRCALGADLDDSVRGCSVDLVDEVAVDIGEDDFIAGVVEEAGNKATAWGMLEEISGFVGLDWHTDVASTKVNCLFAHLGHCDL